ncbi:MAG TPA: FtsX-like permease family protein [Myxococcota bacterium]|nr:FtsX-like permease family protein [Myxococcota bacterium]
MTLLRLALRELRNDPRFAGSFVFCLALGFAGFVALDAFQDSVARELAARSRAYLGGDVRVESRRPLTQEEQARYDDLAGPGARTASLVELFSMAASGGRARLVELCAIDADYPLYGEIVLEGSGAAGEAERRALREGPGLWADPVLLRWLELQPGDTLALGSARFTVQGAIERDSARPTRGFSLAPRVYVAMSALAATELVATGSRIEYRRVYLLAEGGDAHAVARAMRLVQDDPQLEVRAHDEAAGELTQVYARVADALSLVALAAVFLACVGSAHLFRAFLLRRLGDVAILLALGATRRRAEQLFLTQLALLGVAAGLAASALGALLLPLAAHLARNFLPADFTPTVGWRAVAVVTVLAAAGGVATCLPLLLRLRELRPAQLFAEGARPSLSSRRGALLPQALAWTPAALLFVGICLWRAPLVSVGLWFAALFAVALGGLALLGAGLLRGAAALPSPRALAARLALRELSRGGSGAVSCFAALALCVFLQGLAPQLRASLARDLETPGAETLPSLFLFDIQPEQRDAIARHVEAHDAQLTRVSPLVRARLASLRGEPVRDAADGDAPPARSRLAREGEDDGRRLRARGYNLTYRDELAPGERILEGRPFSHVRAADGLPEISLERSFAERLGVGVGDALGFDVQGVTVEGRVVSLREVHWQSFEPNFFVLFQGGVLEDAPQTYLASVPQLAADRREALQASLAEAFPNVSSVDVTRLVERLLALASRLEWALTGTAALSLCVGLAVVFAIARDQARARRLETNLLKVLGADFRRVRAALDLEYGALGLAAALAGSAVCALASALLARLVLEVPWRPALWPLVGAALCVPLACIVAARLAARRVLRERPLALLQLHSR